MLVSVEIILFQGLCPHVLGSSSSSNQDMEILMEVIDNLCMLQEFHALCVCK
jgi:hypothetical protein